MIFFFKDSLRIGFSCRSMILLDQFEIVFGSSIRNPTVNNIFWDKVLSATLFAYRTVNHNITQYKPFYLVYERIDRLLIKVELDTIPSTQLLDKEY